MNSRLWACLFVILMVSGCINKSFVVSAEVEKSRSVTDEYLCVVKVDFSVENPNDKIAPNVRLDIAVFDIVSEEKRDYLSFYLYDLDPYEVRTGMKEASVECSGEKVKLILMAESSDDPLNIRGKFEKDFQVPRNV